MTEWLTVKQVAEALSYHPEYVRKLAREQKLPGCRVGKRGSWRFNREQIQRILKEDNHASQS